MLRSLSALENRLRKAVLSSCAARAKSPDLKPVGNLQNECEIAFQRLLLMQPRLSSGQICKGESEQIPENPQTPG